MEEFDNIKDSSETNKLGHTAEQYDGFVIIDGVLSKYSGEDMDVIIPDNVTTIDKIAFAEALHVESIAIPDTVKIIADKIFGDINDWGGAPKPQLKKLVIGNGVTSIGKGAFMNCSELTDISFGKSLSSIGEEAFAGCENIKAIDLSKTVIKEIEQAAFKNCLKVKELMLPENIEIIGREAFYGISLGIVKLPKSVKRVERSAFFGSGELIVYDSIDPDAVWASDWKYDKWNGTVNSPLACAMIDVHKALECRGNATWTRYHITVLSTDTGEIRYRIFCGYSNLEAYYALMFSAWGKHASFIFNAYDAHFMGIPDALDRTEMAFCRIQYPEGLNAIHRANYEAFLERCLYARSGAATTVEVLARDDNVERLKLLDSYHAIYKHKIEDIRELLERKNAEKCLAYLDEKYSK